NGCSGIGLDRKIITPMTTIASKVIASRVYSNHFKILRNIGSYPVYELKFLFFFVISTQPLPKYPLPSALASSLVERGLNCSLSPQVRNEPHGERAGDRGLKAYTTTIRQTINIYLDTLH